MQRLGGVLPRGGAHSPPPQRSGDRLALLVLLYPPPSFPSLVAFVHLCRQGNPWKTGVWGNFSQDVAARSQKQHLKRGNKDEVRLEKTPRIARTH